MKRMGDVIVPVLGLIILAAVSGCAGKYSNGEMMVSDMPVTAKTKTAAHVGEEMISMDELDQASQEELRRLQTEIYDIKSKQLGHLVESRLIELEAQSRGVSVEEVRRNIQPGRERDFYSALKEKYKVKIELEPPRMEINLADSPVRGAKDAPVTIVEFSDFECPFCSRLQPTIRQIFDHYGEQVKFVFKHFPLPFHRRAKTVHSAALCAEEQGRFWEFRDMIFERPGQIEMADLRSGAQKLGLDISDFDKCLSEGRYDSKIESDFQEGVELGVQGTPAFFINGRPLSGAQPYSAFAQIIDEEL